MANKIVLDRFPSIDYAIVYWEGNCTPFVATWHLNEDNPDKIYWGQGHYFTNLLDCVHYVEELIQGKGS